LPFLPPFPSMGNVQRAACREGAAASVLLFVLLLGSVHGQLNAANFGGGTMPGGGGGGPAQPQKLPPLPPLPPLPSMPSLPPMPPLGSGTGAGTGTGFGTGTGTGIGASGGFASPPPPVGAASAGYGGYGGASPPRGAGSPVVEEIQMLMGKFEGFHSKLGSLPPQRLQAIGSEGQALHERFIALQQEANALGGNPDEALAAQWESSRLMPFRDDLRGFVVATERELADRVGEAPTGGFGGSFGPLPGASVGASAAVGAAGSAASGGRFGGSGLPPPSVGMQAPGGLEATMASVQSNMQAFETLRPRLLAIAGTQLFEQLAERSEAMHREFLALQESAQAIERRGATSAIAEAEVADYASKMADFAKRLDAWVKHVDGSLPKSGSGSSGSMPPSASMVGAPGGMNGPGAGPGRGSSGGLPPAKPLGAGQSSMPSLPSLPSLGSMFR